MARLARGHGHRGIHHGAQLAGPLGMTLVPNGDLVVANATNGKVVEIKPSGQQVGSYYAIEDVGQDPPGNGDLFDLAVSADGTKLYVASELANTVTVPFVPVSAAV